jgi:hypothetical protein
MFAAGTGTAVDPLRKRGVEHGGHSSACRFGALLMHGVVSARMVEPIRMHAWSMRAWR